VTYEWGTDGKKISLAVIILIAVSLAIPCLVTVGSSANQLTVSLSASGDTQNMKAGDNATFTATVSGGQQPYHYQWVYFQSGGSPNPVEDDTNVFVFTADSYHTGTFTVTITVTDSLDNTAFDSFTPITVVPEFTALLIVFLFLMATLLMVFIRRAHIHISSRTTVS
jgi:hypothetical protein